MIDPEELKYHPICKWCGKHTEKYKQVRKDGNVCNACAEITARESHLNYVARTKKNESTIKKEELVR